MNKLVKIRNEFPEFIQSDQYINYEDLPYVFISFFGDYLIAQTNNHNNDKAKKIADFINNTYNSGTLEDQNQIWIGIFETIGSDQKIISLLQNNLSNKALIDFKKFLDGEVNP